MSDTRYRSIVSHLISRIVLLALVGMSLFVGLLGIWEYESGKRSFKADMELHASSSLLPLSNALWDIDPQVVRQQVQSLSQLPQVDYVRVTVAISGETVEDGQTAPDGREAALKMDIPAPRLMQAQQGVPMRRWAPWKSGRAAASMPSRFATRFWAWCWAMWCLPSWSAFWSCS